MKTHLDLCSGIGGFALAARWAGYDTIGFCEIDPWCRRVLAKHWPGVPQHDDLWTLTAATVREWIGEHESALVNSGGSRRGRDANHQIQAGRDTTDHAGRELSLITGGYPCQPFSLAGKRLGAEDDRHLWPAIAALVADLRPARCLFENVGGHVTMGLDAVLSDLEAIGYTCCPVVIPAAAVGAPHRRDRVWILADSERGGRREPMRTDASQGSLLAAIGREGASGVGPSGEDVADTAARGIRRGGTSGQPGLAARGREDVADADGRRFKQRDETERRLPVIDQNGDDCTVGVSANADCAGRGEQRRAVTDEPQHAAIECGSGREAVSGMGDPSDGLPGWLVGPDRLNPWAGDWEAECPRTTTHEPDRTNKLKALGNAIVPQVAYEILRALEAA